MRFNLRKGGSGLATAAAALLSSDKDAAQALGDLSAGRAEANDDDKGHVVVDPPAGAASEPAPAAGADGAATGSDHDKDKEKKDGDDDDQAAATARAEGHRAGASAQLERCLTVMRSEHFAGREPLATELLAGDMPADKIVAALAVTTKADSNSMLGNLSAQPNPALGAGKPAGGGQVDAKASWDRTMSKLGFTKKD
ncbi:hypothetical protein [Rhizorhabdus sp.]|uniref:hypothetical protein n=1 Tax=Rhizorhabdus sp. TaxID=1968843 RepID=UPI0035B0D8BE